MIDLPMPVDAFFQTMPVLTLEVSGKKQECDRLYLLLTTSVLEELDRLKDQTLPYDLNAIFLTVLPAIQALAHIETFNGRSFLALDMARSSANNGDGKECFYNILEARYWTQISIGIEGIPISATPSIPLGRVGPLIAA